MPIITGSIDSEGAIIDLLIEAPIAHRRNDQNRSSSSSIAIRGVLDTGAALTGISRRLLKLLGLDAVGTIPVRTPVGLTQITDRYMLNLAFVSGGTKHDFAEALVIATDCFDEHDELQALIGRDVLNHCSFQYWGQPKRFQFAF